MTKLTSALLSILLLLAAGSAYAYDATGRGANQGSMERGSSSTVYSPAQSG